MSDPDPLSDGRAAYDGRVWDQARAALLEADARGDLGAEDLERLGRATYMLAEYDAFREVFERAHRAWLEQGETRRAVGCAFWIGMTLLVEGRSGASAGWRARAYRLLAGEQDECPEHGYMLLADGEVHNRAGDLRGALDLASRAADIGARHRDADLAALALHLKGRLQLDMGEVDQGLATLDEAMLAVVGGEVSPMVTGVVYCSVIAGCHAVFALNRAHEWTLALGDWCDTQHGMVSFTGQCHVHRAELMQLRGAWDDAVVEVERARAVQHEARQAAAWYQLAEVHRLRGEHAAAEDAYTEVIARGRDGQPGLSLLHLARGDVQSAAASIGAALQAAPTPPARARLLAACVEISLHTGDVARAREAADELDGLRHRYPTAGLQALGDQARGAVMLAEGRAGEAIPPLRAALQAWLEIEASHPAACVRVLLGEALDVLGDVSGRDAEWRAARTTFERLGAAPDLEAMGTAADQPLPGGLTERELEVLRLVASGKTNKQVASELFLSVKTVDRHLSNVFNKLGVASRAAATAWIYQHGLA